MAKKHTDKLLLERYMQVGRMIAAMMPSIIEVVIHDYRRAPYSVVAVFNGHVTGRRVGDKLTSLGFRRIQNDRAVPDELFNYENKSPRGRPLKSSSLAIRNDQGELIGALCINCDISLFQDAGSLLLDLTRAAQALDTPEELRSGNAEAEIKEALATYLAARSLRKAELLISDKRAVVAALMSKGLFTRKGAVTIVARELELTRPSVYKYMREAPTDAKAAA